MLKGLVQFNVDKKKCNYWCKHVSGCCWIKTSPAAEFVRFSKVCLYKFIYIYIFQLLYAFIDRTAADVTAKWVGGTRDNGQKSCN